MTSSVRSVRPGSEPEALPCPKCGAEPDWTMEGLGCPCESAGSGVYFIRLEDWNRYAAPSSDGDATQINRPPHRAFDARAVLESFNANAAKERRLTGRSTSLVEFLRFNSLVWDGNTKPPRLRQTQAVYSPPVRCRSTQ